MVQTTGGDGAARPPCTEDRYELESHEVDLTAGLATDDRGASRRRSDFATMSV